MKIFIYITTFRLIFTTQEVKDKINKEEFYKPIISDINFTSYYEYDTNICDSLIFYDISSEISISNNIIPCDSNVNVLSNLDLNNLDFNNLSSNSPNSLQDIDHDQSINNTKIDEPSENCIVDFLDNIDTNLVPETFEELNNSNLQVLDPKEVDEFFKNEQSKKVINSLKNYVNETDQNKILEIKRIKANSKTCFTYKMKDKDRNDVRSKKYMIKVRKAIIMFVKNEITKFCHSFYFNRLEKIEKALKDFMNVKHIKNNKNNWLDSELLTALDRLHLNFKNLKTLNKKTFKIFSKKFDLEILKVKNTNIYKDMLVVSENNGMFNFYLEMMKLYKYITEIPELMTLWRLFLAKSYIDISFFFHLINLFLENIGNPKENELFVQYMIHKIFSLSHVKCLDLFLAPKYNLICRKEHLNNIYFFLWEVQCSKRVELRKKMGLKKILVLSHNEITHFKTILLIYLYQHVEFLIYYNFDNEVIENFIKFIIKVLKPSICFACMYDEFLRIVKTHINILK